MKRVALALFLTLLLTNGSAAARYKAKHVEGVVASVDGRPILVSEVRRRAKVRIEENGKRPAKERVAEERIFEEVLEQLIDERLMLADADRLHISATSEEIDAAVSLLAKDNQMTPEQLYDYARSQGLLQYEYRDMLRKQIILARWQRLRQKPGTAQKDLLVELAKRFPVERDLL